MEYSPTWISDNFPLKELECQYFDICKFYDPGKCGYNTPCEERQYLRDTLEDYVSIDNLKFQIKLIIENEQKK